MSLLHPGLLYGLILAAIPVVLHFLMRARPKQYDFPALRLLETIRKQNVQRLRLRHLGLLLLRILLLVLLVFAVARPTLPAANYSFTAVEWGKLIAILLLTMVGYWLAQHFWASSVPATSQRLFRQSWLRAGTVAGMLLLLLLLVAWPYQQRVSGEIKNPGDQRQLNVPVSAVLLFDVSASTGYRYENQTRLQQAFELAQQQVQGFPAGSRVAIADNAQASPINFLNDLNAAQTRLQRTDVQTPREMSLPLNERVLAAIGTQDEHRQQILNEGGNQTDRFLREIYIYTDGARSAWSLETAKRLRAEVERCPWLHCYVIDVGVDEPINYTLRQLELSREQAVQGSLLRLTADLDNQSAQQLNSVVELHLNDQSGTSVKRDQVNSPLAAGESGQVSFTFPADRLGAIQGELRLTNTDPLEVDNLFPFTIQIEQRPTIALVGESTAELFVWQQALAPAGLVERGAHQYDVVLLTPQQLAARLQENAAPSQPRPDVVYLLNVSRLTPGTWQALQGFVENGGGLGLIFGHSRIDAQNYRDSGQASWLPALPTVYSPRAEPPVLLEVNRSDHPVFRYLKQLDALSVYSTAEVHHFWKTELQPTADVLARFRDAAQSPAVVAGAFGRGRVVTVNTAVDLQGASEQRNWSELARLGWIYTAWADQMTKFLRAGERARINRAAGETMLLTLPEQWNAQEALLQLPGLRQGKITLPYRGPLLLLSTGSTESSSDQRNSAANAERFGADRLGNYRVVMPQSAEGAYGFSIHLPPDETNLTRLSHAELDELFGPERWQLSRSYAELERTVLLGRIGQEAYPLLISLLIAFFMGEHLVANLFYGRAER